MFNKLYLFFFILIVSCKSESPEVATGQVSLFKDEIPQDFLSFYDRFHSDSLYQLEHVIFPLKQKKDSSMWNMDEWLMHKPFNAQGGEFTRSYTHLNGIVVESINDKNGLFSVERRFSKSSDDYNLIYYEVRNAYENSDFEEDTEER